MDEDRGFARFFSYLNFFVFSMLLLVLAGNFLLLIVGWAFVGAASYLLISFWYRRTTATRAGIKAFVINVVGDVGLVLGTFFIFKHTGTLDFLQTFHAAAAGAFGHGTNNGDLVAGCVLLLVGAFAKSAQIPLHTWLPDAMEGPTPVSALIHAATMVTAGVYLIARMHPLFELRARRAGRRRDHRRGDAADRRHDRASSQTDIKRVIAYSTMSQIGYMIMGVSVGAYAAGPVPPDDPRLLQGAAVHGRRLAHRRDGRRAVAGEDGRLSQGDAVHLRLLPDRRPGAVGHPAVLGLLLQGRDPARHRRARRLALGAVRGRLRRRVADRDLHLPDDLPRLPRRARAPRRASCEAGHLHHAEVPTNPATGESRGHRRRLPRPHARDRRARAADARRDGRCWRWARSAPGSCRSRKSTS